MVVVPLAVAVGETDPQLEPLQVMLHVTPSPEESSSTVALNFALACGCTVAVVVETDTWMAGGG